MQTFTQALIEHVLAGEVDAEVAANAATNRHDFLVSLEQALKRRQPTGVQTDAPDRSGGRRGAGAVEAPSSSRSSPDGGFGLRIVPAG